VSASRFIAATVHAKHETLKTRWSMQKRMSNAIAAKTGRRRK
jgi:hypothetical protein|tara:strand:+ start:602 stop:727 length:126 start_codon:yes stop_codon:yes gene_type:complete